MRWSRGARGRVPRLAHRRVNSSGRCGLHLATTAPRRLSGASPGSRQVFFKEPRRPARFARSGAAAPRSWRSRAPSTRARPAVDGNDAPGRPPAHDAVDRRDRAGLNNLRCAAVIGVELRGCAGDFPSTSPSGPRALKLAHPVANDLQTDAADPRRIRPAANRRPRPTPADDGSGSRPWSSSRSLSKSFRKSIALPWRTSLVHHIESEIGPLGNPQRESGIPLGGITRPRSDASSAHLCWSRTTNGQSHVVT